MTSHIARCQECIDLLVDYLEGELPPERASALDIHLEMCPPCVAFVRTYQGTVDVARNLPVDEIPPELAQRLLDFLRREKEGTLPPPPPA
ncbi:MAG TPA: zf-HC2 domain-containing protein [Methylomirabilota bacterium]|nr:zf-HC2 domain-containing protein [Methylomirabilota bacterium]